MSEARRCQWVTRSHALRHFAVYDGPTQSQQHIKPLHWYVTCRLVLEGGFLPDEIKPRPPFRVIRRSGRHLLHYDPECATGAEATVLGGLKTKNVDVVVSKEGIGPVLAISCKGMTGAFRNLTNRMEETVGDCTNLHITYPALVLGYLFVVRANRSGADEHDEVAEQRPRRRMTANDIAIGPDGSPVETIVRFHSALCSLTGRSGIRDDVSRYEAVSLAMIDVRNGQAGQPLKMFPPQDSPLYIERFFDVLYLRYDERYVYGAPDLRSKTRRIEWSPDSPAFATPLASSVEYDIRLE